MALCICFINDADEGERVPCFDIQSGLFLLEIGNIHRIVSYLI